MPTPYNKGTPRENRELNYADDRIFNRAILVAIDFSERTAKTVTYAVSVAACFSCPVTLLHVINLQDYPMYQYSLEYTVPDRYISQYEYAESEARNGLKPFENLFSSRGLPVGIEIRVGSPFEEILTAAERCCADLIVIGSHRRTGIGRLLLGSTTERVIERARCPVLVVTGE
jgi:nucleotide-binding universal stress UspA family protein